MAVPLAGLLLTAASAAVMVAALKARFKLGAYSALFWLAMLWVLGRLVIPNPPPVTGFIGPAGQAAARQNLARRAWYVLAATTRVMNAMLTARATGGEVTRAGLDALRRERLYYSQHLNAMWVRARNAMTIDMTAAQHGPLLGWLAVLDNRTTPECRWASGKNFYADNPPYIGWPGVGPHVNCRCRPVAPWPGGQLLPGTGPRYRRRAA
jgi:hypothetical protein